MSRPPGYVRTLLWSRTLRRPRGNVKARPYWKAIELSLQAVKSGYGDWLPEAASYTMLEFGVAGGDSFERMLHYRDVLARRLRLRTRVTCVGFDTFAGLPAASYEDIASVWREGDFTASVESVRDRLSGYRDFTLVEGLFAETVPAWQKRLEQSPPLFVSLDCDYYSSTIDVFETILPLVPSGCFFYFDDGDAHYWSDRAGELRAVREVNEGRFGEHLQLAEYPLWIETRELRHYRKLYRLLNLETASSSSRHTRRTRSQNGSGDRPRVLASG